MKHWKRLLALILCGCLAVGLSACGEKDKPEEQTKEQTEAVGSASAQSEPSETENEPSEKLESSDSFSDEEEADEQTDDSEADDEYFDDETEDETESDDESADFEEDMSEGTDEDAAASEDGEAKEEISQDDALQLVIDYFDTEDAGSGYAYAYTLVRADDIDGQSYYIFRQSWAEDEEDAEAGAKVLRYIFVATDGSVLYTGVVDGEQSVIDYDSEIIP